MRISDWSSDVCSSDLQDDDLRTGSGLARDPHMTARLVDEAMDLAESQPAAPADVLRREERFERPPQHLRRHAGAGVGDAGLDIGPRRQLPRAEPDVPGRYPQPAAVRHGVPRIDRQVQDRGLELPRIDPAGPEIRLQLQHDLDRLADGAPQQLVEFVDQPVAADGFGTQALAAGEGEQLAGQTLAQIGTAPSELKSLMRISYAVICVEK